MEITCRFKARIFFGDTSTAKASVADKIEDKRWVHMPLTWTNQREETIAEGEALVIPPPENPQHLSRKEEQVKS